MKHILFNLFFIFVALISGVGMFLLKYRVLEKEAELAALQKSIIEHERTIHIDKAELANLADPDRVEILVKRHTNFVPMKPEQVIRFVEIDNTVKEKP